MQDVERPWPAAADVLGVMKSRWPDTYGQTIRISYTPGTGEPLTAEQVAEAMHQMMQQCTDPVGALWDEGLPVQDVADWLRGRADEQ